MLTCNVSIYMYLKQNDGSKMKPTDDRRDKKRNCLGIPSSQIPDQQTRNPPAANERSIILTLGPFWAVLLTEISQKVSSHEKLYYSQTGTFLDIYFIFTQFPPNRCWKKKPFFVRSCLGLCLDKNSQKMCKKNLSKRRLRT